MEDQMARKIVYRVHFRESERGWGQSFFHTDYNTLEEAMAAIKNSNDRNAKEYAETKRVPDYYIQPERDHPEVVEV
jgi:hypothetical protein